MRCWAGRDGAGASRIAVAIACLVCLFLAAQPARAQPSVTTRFDIASQPLASALAEFAGVSGVDIAYRQNLAVTRRSGPVRGDLSAPVGLHLLLEGTGLVARFTGPRAAIIFEPGATDVPAPRRGGAAIPSLRLDMAEVRAPMMVGSPDRAGHRHYALAAENEIRAWLRDADDYEGRALRLEIRIFVDPRGRIRQVTVRRPSSEAAWDAQVARILTGRSLSHPPPGDLSEPLVFEVVSDPGTDRGRSREGSRP